MTDNKEMIQEKNDQKQENRESIFIPKSYSSDDPNFYIGVNGVGYLLPRGENALVPPHVARAFERAQKMERMRDKRLKSLKKM